MELSNIGSMLPNDQVQVSGSLTYGGTLIVTNIGANALTAGVEFPLFNANSYGGGFASISLPPLDPGLTWTNKLLLDGSIQVLGPSLKFGAITLSGTNLLISGSGGPANSNYWVLTTTNLNVGLSNWTRLLTNQFDGSGNFIFTNGINSSIRQRYYRLQVP